MEQNQGKKTIIKRHQVHGLRLNGLARMGLKKKTPVVWASSLGSHF
jgi:hypothetical protein